MIGDLVMTEHHCVGKEVVDDVIGWAAYTMDSHNCDRIVVRGEVKNEGNVEIGGFPPYPISYRAITPKRREVTNLLVPVCLSASHIAYGFPPHGACFYGVGSVGGCNTFLSIDNGIDVQDMDIARLQEVLRTDPLSDGSVPEILVDNDDKSCVELNGAWRL